MKHQNFVIFILIICLILSLFNASASADALTATIIGGCALGIAAASGFVIEVTNGDSNGVQRYIESQVNSYLNGRTITEVFGDEIVTELAGKLVLPAVLANNIIDFVDWIKDQGTGEVYTEYGGIPANTLLEPGGQTDSGFSAQFDIPVGQRYSYGEADGKYARLFYNGGQVAAIAQNNFQSASNYRIPVGYLIQKISDSRWRFGYHFDQVGYTPYTLTSEFTLSPAKSNQIVIDEDAYSPPVVERNQSLVLDGSWPDTNLDQIMGDIFSEIANNDINIDQEVIDDEYIPTPIPTVIPGDIDGYWNRNAEQIGSLNEGINDINIGLRQQTGVLDDTKEAVETISESIKDAISVPDSSELPSFKFDLRELFPFCIPFDIYRLLTSFDAEPAAPHVQLPIVIESIGFSYNMDLDFSAWNPVAQAMRTAELIVYAIGLAWATGKVIKW